MHQSKSVFCAAAAICAFAALPLLTYAQTQSPATPQAQVVYVKAGHLFDATSDKLRDNVVLVIEGERISKVAAAGEIKIPADAKVVDLSNAYVLPGLIDCHTHLEARADRYDPINEVKDTPFMGGFNGVVNAASETLQSGLHQRARRWFAAILRGRSAALYR